jgi:GNAT superfamily N-acetyltransferase
MSMLVRPLRPADRESVIALSDRLTVGVAPWRDAEAVAAAVRSWLVDATSDRFDGSALVAELDGAVVGFVSVATTGHFAGEVDADIGELVVDAGHEARGVGAALVAAAEQIARDRGHRCLTLTTGAANERALGFYHRLGFVPEDVKLTKVLDRPGVTDDLSATALRSPSSPGRRRRSGWSGESSRVG